MSDKDKKRYYWLKLKEDFFEEDTIQWLEEQDNGKEYSLIYLKLCLKSLKTDGVLVRNVGEMLLPYDEKSIAKMTNSNIDTVIIAMSLFKKIGLIEFLENGEMFLTQLEELVGNETYAAKRKRLERAKKNVVKEELGHTWDNVAQSIEYRDKSIEYIENNTNNVQNESATDSLQERFDKLWKLYPIKKGKTLAFKSYKRDIKKKDVTDSLIEKGIIKYISNCKKENTDKRYMKHGGTFFSQQVYLDDYEAEGSMQEVESSNKPKPVVIPADWIN